MSTIEQARQLLSMAAKDIKALDLMILPESIDDEIFGFHAQQAVEKSLKAWISAIGGSYGFVHDLRILFQTLRELGCSIDQFRHLISLNPLRRNFAMKHWKPRMTASTIVIFAPLH